MTATGYSEKKLSPCHFVHQISYGPNWDRNLSSSMKGRRLTVRIRAQPNKKRRYRDRIGPCPQAEGRQAKYVQRNT
jgi:hypothetical protein